MVKQTSPITGKEPKDAVELILADHETVRNMFKEFITNKKAPKQKKLQLVKNIVREMSIHASIEERYLYPMLTKIPKHGPTHKDRCVMEHQAMKEMLDYVDTHPPKDEMEMELFESSVAKCMALMDSHMKEEEETVVPQLLEQLSEGDQQQLFELMLKGKQTAPTKPHPEASPLEAEDAEQMHPQLRQADQRTEEAEKPLLKPPTSAGAQGSRGRSRSRSPRGAKPTGKSPQKGMVQQMS